MTALRSRATRPGLVGLLLCVALGGCATATIEDAVPVSASTGFPEGPVDTNVYPDLNVRPAAAASQIAEGERAATSSALVEARSRLQADPAIPAATTATTRSELEIRKNRGDEVLQEIEGKPATQ